MTRAFLIEAFFFDACADTFSSQVAVTLFFSTHALMLFQVASRRDSDCFFFGRMR